MNTQTYEDIPTEDDSVSIKNKTTRISKKSPVSHTVTPAASMQINQREELFGLSTSSKDKTNPSRRIHFDIPIDAIAQSITASATAAARRMLPTELTLEYQDIMTAAAACAAQEVFNALMTSSEVTTTPTPAVSTAAIALTAAASPTADAAPLLLLRLLLLLLQLLLLGLLPLQLNLLLLQGRQAGWHLLQVRHVYLPGQLR